MWQAAGGSSRHGTNEAQSYGTEEPKANEQSEQGAWTVTARCQMNEGNCTMRGTAQPATGASRSK